MRIRYIAFILNNIKVIDKLQIILYHIGIRCNLNQGEEHRPCQAGIMHSKLGLGIHLTDKSTNVEASGESQ